MEKHSRSLASVGSELAHFHVIELFTLFGRLVCLPDLSSECQLYYQVNLQCM